MSTKSFQTKINMPHLVFRCYREINHSQTPAMLEVAHKYYLLFVKFLIRNNVDMGVVKNIESIMLKAYKRKYKLLNF